ncbi:putative sodium-coupled neutral amino acid transporter 6 isoform 2-T2 [Odontesthes bonariensis]|uniref:putative sodium-coupled neutral amino acid transporter 6 isoform X2 n=1 Tax=Odontesthes bonariensis TaxID=219752 RepID=UPI003F581D9A
MSINGHAHADLYRERTSRDTEGGETTPLLGNGSVQTRATGASFTSSVFNLMNAIMGSGILGLAYAMASTGIVGFSILLVLVSSLALYSIHLLLKLCDQTGINSYEDLGGKALHKPGKVLVGIAILIQNIGGMSSYLFILKSELPAAINSFLSPEDTGNAWYDDGKLLLILVTVCIVLPLSMSPKIGFLSYTSSLAFLFMLYFAVVVVVKKWSIPCPLPHNVTTLSGTFKISNFSESECTPKLFVISIKSAYAIPTMAFSFLCHTAVLPIYCELERPTKARMQKVSNISIGLSFLLYFISALFGYLTFYNHVDSELLLGYDAYLPRDIMVMTVRLAVLIAVLLTVPLIHFPARKAAILLLFGGRSFSWLIHIISTLTILSVVLILAIFVPDISNVFGVVGSTMSSCLLFVFPGIFYLKISGQPLRSVDSIGAILLVVFGLIMGVMSLCVIIVTWVKSS